MDVPDAAVLVASIAFGCFLDIFRALLTLSRPDSFPMRCFLLSASFANIVPSNIRVLESYLFFDKLPIIVKKLRSIVCEGLVHTDASHTSVFQRCPGFTKHVTCPAVGLNCYHNVSGPWWFFRFFWVGRSYIFVRYYSSVLLVLVYF